jgi:hypothetical protein
MHDPATRPFASVLSYGCGAASIDGDGAIYGRRDCDPPIPLP